MTIKTKASRRLLALDMDGTLLNSRKEVTPATAKALKSLRDRGIVLALCTGRNISDGGEIREAMTLFDYAIFANGAHIVDLASGRTLAVNPLPRRLAAEVLRAVETEDMVIRVLCEDRIVMRRRDLSLMAPCHIPNYEPLMRRIAAFYDSEAAFMAAVTSEGEAAAASGPAVADTSAAEPPLTVLKIVFSCRDWETALRNKAKADAIPGLTSATSDTPGFEISAAGVDKGEGLKALCRYLDIPVSAAVAAGDSGNDIPSVRAAGLGIAMGNAEEAVIAAADVTVADCDHEGVVEIVRRFF